MKRPMCVYEALHAYAKASGQTYVPEHFSTFDPDFPVGAEIHCSTVKAACLSMSPDVAKCAIAWLHHQTDEWVMLLATCA